MKIGLPVYFQDLSTGAEFVAFTAFCGTERWHLSEKQLKLEKRS